MSSNRPPQLQLSLHGEHGTSFKRSFEQFGFDLGTPLDEAGGSALSGVDSGGGNDRNKRARSESSLSNSDEVAESSGSSEGGAAGSSGATSIENDGLSGVSVTRPISLTDNVRLAPPVRAEPPRLPTPHFDDIHMSILDDSEPLSSAPIASASASNRHENYRISLERFNAFDNEISALRQPASRSSASPPILPPLSSAAEGEDGEANARVPAHLFGNIELVEEDANIPGLQVFTLGELSSSEDDVDTQGTQNLCFNNTCQTSHSLCSSYAFSASFEWSR